MKYYQGLKFLYWWLSRKPHMFVPYVPSVGRKRVRRNWFNLETKQDPVYPMQKTGWTIHSPFLVLFGLKKNFTLDVITRGQATTIFLCIGPFSAWWRTTKRTPGWSKSKPALDQCEKTVFCKKCVKAHTLINNIFFTFFRGVTRFLNVGFSGTLCLHSDFNLS